MDDDAITQQFMIWCEENGIVVLDKQLAESYGDCQISDAQWHGFVAYHNALGIDGDENVIDTLANELAQQYLAWANDFPAPKAQQRKPYGEMTEKELEDLALQHAYQASEEVAGEEEAEEVSDRAYDAFMLYAQHHPDVVPGED